MALLYHAASTKGALGAAGERGHARHWAWLGIISHKFENGAALGLLTTKAYLRGLLKVCHQGELVWK